MTDVSTLTNITPSLSDIYGDTPDDDDVASDEALAASPKSSPVTRTRQKVLPPHWEKVRSEQHHRCYYWHRETGKTTWNFPEEEAKEHSKVVRSHDYINVKRTPPIKGPRRLVINDSTHSTNHDTTEKNQKNETFTSTPPPQRSTTSPPMTTLPPHMTTTPTQRSTPPPQRPRSSYVNVELVSSANQLPPEPMTPLSPVPMDTRLSLTQSDEGVSPMSPTLLHSEGISPLSPTPIHSEGISPLSPTPIHNEGISPLSPTPIHNEGISPLSPSPPIPPRHYSESEFSSDGSATPTKRSHQSNSSTEDCTSPQSTRAPVKHTFTTQGHEYAVIHRGGVKGEDENTPIMRILSPPPPVPMKPRQRLAQDAHKAGYTEIAEKSLQNRVYAELEMPSSHSDDSNQNPKSPIAYAVVDLGKETAPSAERRRQTTTRKELIPLKPRPYETPTLSMENLADPGYETVRDKLPGDDGYMEVDRNTLLSYQRTYSVGQTKTRRVSSKELYTLPPGKDTGESPLSRKGSPSTGEESPSQDYVFDSPYDLPSNSKKLSVTLPRTSAPPSPGYSRLEDLSKEAILLRSGVTLRRYQQLDSVSSLRSQGGPGSEESSGSDHDDALEPVHRAIKSLETSLGVSADGSPLQLVRTPPGPPSWTKVQRRPHAYEPVNDSLDVTAEPANQIARKQHLTSSSIEMDWDETELSAPKSGLTRVQELSQQRSSSQPNLLRDSDVVFPHLEKPPRVSEEAFKMRQNRLLNHKYEDMEKGEESGDVTHSAESVGDVTTLNSAGVKESWTEGGGLEGELPRGWQNMKDETGRVYYWHVPSGRTQYNRPTGDDIKRLSLCVDDSHTGGRGQASADERRRPSPAFRAHFIGSWDVDESELVQGQCVKVVHSCISNISGDSTPTKDSQVFLQVHNASLRWLDPETSSPTLTQPINKIRVWGIGLDNERHFGYVARDIVTKRHKCHVFRCERPARAVARALLEAHQRDRQEKRARKATKKEESAAAKELVKEPSVSASQSQHTKRDNSQSPEKQDEYKRITCTYMGSCDVFQGKEIGAVNEGVSRLCMENHRGYLDVHVDVATSHVRITAVKNDTVIAEHRVRFLVFLGIANDDRYCGYILDNGTHGNMKQLKFHGFRKEPNTDRLCLALHGACQARYQRVLQANPGARVEGVSPPTEKPSPPLKAKSTPNLLERLGSLRKPKKSLVEDESSFVVQYLGCQGVTKTEGLDAVRVPLQQMAQPKTPTLSSTPFLVDFDVTPGGIFITDPQKKVFNRKSFPIKTITYIVRIREYFAFISKDSGKLNCHVFLENEVDAGTVVNTVEKILSPDNPRSPTK